MVTEPTFRTNDGTRWGTGQGSDLSAAQIDINFWDLFAAIMALEDHQHTNREIDYFAAVGNQLFIHMTDHSVLGPITIPTAQWNYRQDGWHPLTIYAAFDVIPYNGALYLVLRTHTSAASFDPNATDGIAGHNLYGLMITQPANALPAGGTIGQRLVKASGSPYVTQWVSEKVRIALYVDGQPNSNELLTQYLCADHMVLKAGLPGSIGYSQINTLTNVSYTISKNGSPIGSIEFDGPSPETVSATFSADVPFVPGDILTINGPASPDAQQANISIVLIALLTE